MKSSENYVNIIVQKVERRPIYMTTVLHYKSPWGRFWGLRKFKRNHPNARVIKKFSIRYGGLVDPYYTIYSVKVEF